MKFTWGATDMSVVYGSYNPGGSASNITEQTLIPEPSSLGTISTNIQQGGRKRKRPKLKALVRSLSDFNDYVTDKEAGTQRTFSDGDTVSGTYAIDSIGDPEFLSDDIITFDLTFLEV